jgi:hypothetical protein
MVCRTAAGVHLQVFNPTSEWPLLVRPCRATTAVAAVGCFNWAQSFAMWQHCAAWFLVSDGYTYGLAHGSSGDHTYADVGFASV